MNIRYTHHARQRMAQRNIAAEQVEEVLDNPEEILPGDYEEETAVRRYGARELRVVYQRIDQDTVVVITVMKSRVRDRKP